MKNSVKENTFKTWVDSIPSGDLKHIKDVVIQECMINDQIFKHWKSGNSKPSPLHQSVINKIAGKVIFKIDK